MRRSLQLEAGRHPGAPASPFATVTADQVRDAGLESISVGKLMSSVGLTHGGFYNHFESRADLLARALERALVDGRKAWLATEGSDDKPRSFETTVRRFLSRSHRESRTTGCAVAALASDVARADEQSRAVMSKHIDDFVSQTANSLASRDGGDAACSQRDGGSVVAVPCSGGPQAVRCAAEVRSRSAADPQPR